MIRRPREHARRLGTRATRTTFCTTVRTLSDLVGCAARCADVRWSTVVATRPCGFGAVPRSWAKLASTHERSLMSVSSVARAVAVLRCAIGVVLIVAPRRAMAGWLGEDADPSTRIPSQSLGAREVALGLGMLGALRTSDSDEARRWLTAGMVGDVTDIVATGFSRSPPARRASIIALAASGAVTGLVLRSRL